MTKPARYPPKTAEEKLAIDTLNALIDPKLVFLDTKTLSTIPNIDGYADILDEDGRPIGKLEVQVKKLPDDCDSSPKLQIPLTLFGYADSSTLNPVLLIGVDVKHRRAYWFPIADLVLDQEQLDAQKTITIAFSVSRVIDGKDTRYAQAWLQIVQSRRMKQRGYDELAAAYAELSKKTGPALGVSRPYFHTIHEFLEEMNALLEGPFSLVERRFYPNAWKVGFAFSRYASDSVGYTLYPIRYDQNDVQIKEIDDDLVKEFTRLHGFTEYCPNPIARNAKQHALERIQNYTSQIIKGKMLDHKGSMPLAREFLFAFIDTFSEQIGTKKGDCYSISDIENGFYRHLPFWVDEAAKLLMRRKAKGYAVALSPSDGLYRKPYVDPDLLRSQISSQEMEEIEVQVLGRIANNSPIPRIPIGSEDLPLGLFIEYDSYLAQNGVTEIHRLYDPPDYSRMPSGGGYLWEAYSRASVEKNLKIIYGNFPEAYSIMIKQSFPQLRDQLRPLHGASDVIVVFDAKDTYASREKQDIPGIELYYLKGKAGILPRISVYHVSECKELVEKLEGNFGKTVELDGRKYELHRKSSSIMRIITEKLPLHTLVYEELKQAMKEYFKAKGLNWNDPPF